MQSPLPDSESAWRLRARQYCFLDLMTGDVLSSRLDHILFCDQQQLCTPCHRWSLNEEWNQPPLNPALCAFIIVERPADRERSCKNKCAQESERAYPSAITRKEAELVAGRSRSIVGRKSPIRPYGSSNPATPASQCGLPTRPPSLRQERAIQGYFSRWASSPRSVSKKSSAGSPEISNCNSKYSQI